ncbi:Tryp_alpha_amyl domain-containing protein [Cephalotus follicularis]|uniref:Non-specific lipid-transfer protein n=1 Tax=Cephalotus follicularis TaxID=3775 RepID=A0A1Q3BH18_CEPFO|nr:Tryp_alpha_amyl domain-containing protein [Cephalotus follicularis]
MANKLAFMLFVCLVVVSAPKCKAAVSCNQMVSELTPCIGYVANGGTVSSDCCNGVKTLYSQAKDTSSRQGICNCMKRAISGIPYTAYNLGLASGLPAKCGVNIPYKIDPSTNCASIK